MPRLRPSADAYDTASLLLDPCQAQPGRDQAPMACQGEPGEGDFAWFGAWAAPAIRLRGEGVAPGAGDLPVLEGLPAGLGRGDQMGGAEAYVLPPPLNGQALDPALAPARGNAQDQPVLVVIPARLPDPPDEGKGQSAGRVRHLRPLNISRTRSMIKEVHHLFLTLIFPAQSAYQDGHSNPSRTKQVLEQPHP